jgi:hypothetical protein
VGAMAVSTRIAGYLRISTIITDKTVETRIFSRTFFYGIHGFELDSRQLIFIPEPFPVLQENRLN